MAALFSVNSEWRVANGDKPPTSVATRYSLLATHYSLPIFTIRSPACYSRSTIVTFAMPPPSHMVCNP